MDGRRGEKKKKATGRGNETKAAASVVIQRHKNIKVTQNKKHQLKIALCDEFALRGFLSCRFHEYLLQSHCYLFIRALTQPGLPSNSPRKASDKRNLVSNHSSGFARHNDIQLIIFLSLFTSLRVFNES